MKTGRTAWLVMLSVMLLCGCYLSTGLGAGEGETGIGPDDTDPTRPSDPMGVDPVDPSDPMTPGEDPSVRPIRDVDIVFMVDNSGSMAEEQAAFRLQMAQMFEVLSTGDLNKDGIPEFEQANSVRVGVISSDMGAGQEGVTTCTNGSYGDDGQFQTGSASPSCGTGNGMPFLSFSNGDSVRDFVNDAECRTVLGTGGCGFEQQLESVLKALTPSTSDTRFIDGTVGHGDGMNGGFLRQDSLLVIIALTDEDDCSTPESAELFSPSSAVYTGGLNLRCWAYEDALHPISRYVQGLLALRNDPSRLLFATVAGVPQDLVRGTGTPDYDSILADPRMQAVPDPMNPTRLTPSCTSPGGVAYPPRRLVALTQALESRGATGVVQSICQEDFGPVMEAVLRRIGGVLQF